MLMETGNPDWRWFVRAGDTVFDVGANAGAKAALFLAQGASVVCIEPQPACLAALRKRFRRHKEVTIVGKGLAEKSGELELSICSQADTISTFSAQWKTGRFASYKWDSVVRVPVSTLDEMIDQHGVPAYCKVDVEGFEVPVLKGLTRPVPLLSFEFVKEFFDNAAACIQHLRQIGFERFNFALGENPQFVEKGWLDAAALFQRIGQIQEAEFWGDVYAQHGDNSSGTAPRPLEKIPTGITGPLKRLLSGQRTSAGDSPHP
jgi:FkbM family methyltransferase